MSALTQPGPGPTPARKIRPLSDKVINQIAAGEVVERPSSVIKELIENCLDAAASHITIAIRDGGKSLIQVTDNGCGMDRDDALLSLERSATSKITDADDLKAVATLGFRGEALASIASVSRLTLSAALPGSPEGVVVRVEGGALKDVKDAPPVSGVEVTVRDLFYNTPVRRKFMRSEKIEAEQATDAVYRAALSRPDVRFTMIRDGKTVFDALPASGEPDSEGLAGRIKSLFGDETANALLPVDFSHAGMRLTGFVSRPGVTRADGARQYVFINGRFIRDRLVNFAVTEGYRSLLPKGRRPALFLTLHTPPDRVDVNVHPTKIEVRFVDNRSVIQLVKGGIYNALAAARLTEAGEGLTGRETGFGFDPSSGYRPGGSSSGPAYPPQADPWRPPKDGNDGNAGQRTPGKPASFAEPVAPFPAPSTDEQAPFSPTEGTVNQPVKPEPASPAGQAPLLHFDSGLPADFRVVGQVFGAFILIEENDRLLLIDQHTAHERVLYEKFMERYREGTPEVQELLFPVEVELGRPGAEAAARFEDDFARLGFAIEPFGDTAVAVRAVPALLGNKEPGGLVHDALERLSIYGDTASWEEMVEDVINVMACRAAVKANDRLTSAEMEGILASLAACQLPYTCPHGRPVALTLERNDLLKGFLRK